MFSVGQRVWHRGGQRSGVVLEVDDGIVYLAQENGAEVEYPVGELTASPPAVGATPGEQLRARVAAGPGQAVPVTPLTERDITPAHARVLAAVPARTLQTVARLFERGAAGQRFSGLGVARKLNVVAELTGVPYRTMREFSDRPGELGLMMGKGLADRGG